MGFESLLNHFQDHELGYNLRMFLISCFAQMQLSVMMAYMYLLAENKH